MTETIESHIEEFSTQFVVSMCVLFWWQFLFVGNLVILRVTCDTALDYHQQCVR